MNICIRRLGQHRGAPRLYLDTAALAQAGFLPGATFNVLVDAEAMRITITLDPCGDRHVSRKMRGCGVLPVIDINSTQDLAPFAVHGVVRVVIALGKIHLLLPATVRKALARAARLATRLALGQPLHTASLSFGAGITSRALHEGLAAGGVAAKLVLANEINDAYIDLAMVRNPVVTAETAVVAAPMQEAAADDWLLGRLPEVDILEAGIPCAGASRAGAAKRKLTRMEDHPVVGHLIGTVMQLIGALQPAIVLIENVVAYRDTASAAILRGWLVDAGYAVHETVLDSHDFGSLEQRVRWFLVACPQQFRLDLAGLAPAHPPRPQLASVLEGVEPDDQRWREVSYLKHKACRDEEAGKHFAMQWLHPASTRVPTLRKGYCKGGSTDPRLMHPTDPTRSRLLTGLEHARIKGIDAGMVTCIGDTLAHQVCGQSVDVRPVQAIGCRIARAMLSCGEDLGSTAKNTTTRFASITEIVG